MSDFDLGTGKRLAGYSLVLGIVYLVFGLIEVFGGTGETIPGDVFSTRDMALLSLASAGIPGMETDEGLDMVTGNVTVPPCYIMTESDMHQSRR